MFNPKWLSKHEIEDLILGDLTEEEITDCRENHLLTPVFNEIVEGTTEPGTGSTVYFKFRGRAEPILDATSQAWSLNLGHAPAEVNYALALQAQHSNHVRYGYLTPVRVKLSNKLAAIAPGKLKGGRVALNNLGGGGAIECAIKTALINSEKADQIAVFWRGYHGSSLALTGGTQQIGFATRFRPFGTDRWLKTPFPYCYRCPWKYSNGFHGKKDPECNLECLDLVQEHLEYHHTTGVAGCIIEPNQGAGGQVPAPAEFLQGLKKICKRNHITLIYDECQTGFGRSGKMWLTEHLSEQLGKDISPDIICATKGAAGGFPLGICIANSKLTTLSESEEHTTYSSSPGLMAASLATIAVLEKHNIPANAAKQGERISKFLGEMQQQYPEIGDIRGPGLFIGIEMVKNPKKRSPHNNLVEKIMEHSVKNGILLGEGMPIINPRGKFMRNIVKIKPPLVISDEETEELCHRFERTFKDAMNDVA